MANDAFIDPTRSASPTARSTIPMHPRLCHSGGNFERSQFVESQINTRKPPMIRYF